MATQQFLYDRVAILADGIEYLPDGQIRSFSMQAAYNNRLQQGMTSNGVATGITIGNRSVTVNWTEFLPTSGDYLNFRTFCIANPNTVFTIIPITLADGVPAGPSFTIGPVQPTSINISAPNEGEVMVRDCSFIAIDSSNL
jgi:hypothetical protein